jgi:hypothetical protein
MTHDGDAAEIAREDDGNLAAPEWKSGEEGYAN